MEKPGANFVESRLAGDRDTFLCTCVFIIQDSVERQKPLELRGNALLGYSQHGVVYPIFYSVVSLLFILKLFYF